MVFIIRIILVIGTSYLLYKLSKEDVKIGLFFSAACIYLSHMSYGLIGIIIFSIIMILLILWSKFFLNKTWKKKAFIVCLSLYSTYSLFQSLSLILKIANKKGEQSIISNIGIICFGLFLVVSVLEMYFKTNSEKAPIKST